MDDPQRQAVAATLEGGRLLPDRPLRVLHVTEATVGGIRQHVHNLAVGLDRRGFRVGIACPAVRRECYGDDYFVEELRDRDVALHLVPMRREPHPMSDLRALAQLVRVARQYDVVHTHSSKAGFLGRLAGRLAGTPATLYTPNAFAFLAGSHGSRVSGLRTVLYFALEQFAARFTDALIACSPSEADAAARLLPRERVHVIPNAIDPTLYEAERAASWARRPRIGMVGRLVPQKAPEVFVRAAAVVLQARPEARFWLAGDGDLRQSVASLAEQLGVTHAIQLLGHRRDIPDLLRETDLFVLTSRYEGLPYSLLEAMASGLPVVATRVPGTVDVVRDGVTGLLVPVDDPAEAAAAILSLLSEPDRARAFGEAGRRRVAEQFSLTAMLAAHESLYRQLALRA